jgi:uncharacterized protein (DUF362 family)
MNNKNKTKDKIRSIKILSFWGILSLIIIATLFNSVIGNDRSYVDMEIIPVEINETDEQITNVSLIQSSKDNVFDITEKDVREMVREAVELAGGLEGIVEDGDTVVLKPNFLTSSHQSGSMFSMIMNVIRLVITGESIQVDRTLSDTANGLTTDYRVAKAVAEMVREINPSGKIYVMEASSIGDTDIIMDLMGYTHENIPEVDAFITMDDAGRNFPENTDDLVAVDIGELKLYEDSGSLAHTNGIYYMDKDYYSADVIIDLPVLKNHMGPAVTGAIKNVGIGSTPPWIYGSQISGGGRIAIDHSYDKLNAFIHDYYLVRPVDFVVTDGLQGLSNGPGGMGAITFESAQMNMRLILAGRDALAVDTVHSLIIGIDPQKVDHITYLADNNVGIMDTSRIHVEGNVKVDEVRKTFRFPGFPYSWLNPESRSCRYSDFKDPVVTVDDFELMDDRFTAKLSSNEELVKLEVYIDGIYVDTLLEQGVTINIDYENEEIDLDSNINIYAYDRFLNCLEIDI